MTSEPTTTEHAIDMTGVEVDQNYDAPIIYVDGLQGFAASHNGQVKINIVQDLIASPPIGKPPGPPRLQRRVAARLVMTLEQFVAMRNWFNALTADLQKQNVIPPDGK